jgi:hypothetical protein
MKLKLDEAGNVVVKDGKAVYVTDEGKDIAPDVPALYASVTDLGVSERAAVQKLAQANAQLKKFEGVDVEKLKATTATADEVTKGFQAKLDEAETARKALETQLSNRIKSGMFTGSAFIGTKRPDNLPADYYEAVFGKNFKVGADGAIEAFDAAGKPIMSRSNPAQMAGFDEAIEQLISAHPSAASLIKGTVVPGTGTNPKGQANAGKTISVAAFDALSGKEQNAKMADGFTLQ